MAHVIEHVLKKVLQKVSLAGVVCVCRKAFSLDRRKFGRSFSGSPPLCSRSVRAFPENARRFKIKYIWAFIRI